MRIIAGTLGGRLFDSPGSHKTHPMSDKVRGALFTMLGDLGGLTVLDAFAGSGALSFEAVSRGAYRVVAIDSDREAQKTIARNSKALGVGDQVKLISATANAWLQTSDQQFDIVLCDPPYDDTQPNLLRRLAGRVTEGGLLVLSWPGSEPFPELPDLELIRHRGYGDAQLAFYRQNR
jgi:16S rRNA (guanine966-N2)-methyltransferase